MHGTVSVCLHSHICRHFTLYPLSPNYIPGYRLHVATLCVYVQYINV